MTMILKTMSLSSIWIEINKIMSIYSGFSTRNTEETYNQTLVKMLQLLQNQLLPSFDLHNLAEDDTLMHFANCFAKLIKKMREFEERKYMPPKFSQVLGKISSKVEALLGDNRTPKFDERDLGLSRLEGLSRLSVEKPGKYRQFYMSSSRRH